MAALVAGAMFPGCKCEQPATAPTVEPPMTLAALSEPKRTEGVWCEDTSGAGASAPEGAFTAGAAFVKRTAGWAEPEDPTARVLHVAGLRDGQRRAEDGAFLVRRRTPGSDLFAVLTAKPKEFPPGTTFDAKGAQGAIDEVAADPRAFLVGAKAVTWGGQPAVEGVVGEPVAGGKIMVHHLIVPTGEKVEAGKGPRALVVTFLAVEDAYHQFLAEACAAVGVTR